MVRRYRNVIARPHKIFLRSNIKFGVYNRLNKFWALISLNSFWLSSNQVESAYRLLRKVVKKAGRLYKKVYPFMPLTAKPAEVRMGKGKGKIKSSAVPVSVGQILFEVRLRDDVLARKSLTVSGSKLPVSSRIVCLRDFN